MTDAEEQWEDVQESEEDEDDDDGAFPSPPPPSFLDPSSVEPAVFGQVKVMIPGRGYTTLAVRSTCRGSCGGSLRLSSTNADRAAHSLPARGLLFTTAHLWSNRRPR